jgi:hypothetical protein
VKSHSKQIFGVTNNKELITDGWSGTVVVFFFISAFREMAQLLMEFDASSNP